MSTINKGLLAALRCLSLFNTQRLRLKSLLSGVFLAFLFTSHIVQAQPSELATPKASDVRILIDISGSMKKNDPANLRRPALDMLIKLLPEGSQAGVWTFGKYVNMLVKHRSVDTEWKREASAKAKTIGSIAQFTNIGDALDKAAYDKTYSTRGNYQTHIILLTDGVVDIDRDPSVNDRERERILNAILPNYQTVDYKIHTVSLSDNADRQLMDQLALGTDGQSVVAKNADELMQVFLQVFDQAVPKEELPFDGNRFATDSSIEEFTALIFRQPDSKSTEILTPDLERYNKDTQDPNLNWYATDQYDLITVKRPLEGEWQVIADLLPESRITVVSDLSLAVKPLPANLLLGDTVGVSLALREESKIIDRAEFLELLDIDITLKHIKRSDKTETQRLSGGLVPGNGVYQTTLESFDTVGRYEIIATVDGKSFQRQFVHRTDVREAFAVDVEPITGQSPQQYKITVTPNIKNIDTDTTEVVGKLKKPSGASTITNFSPTPSNTWVWTMTAEDDGQYHLSIRLTTNVQGQRKSYTPNPFIIQHPQADDVFARIEPEPPKPAPKPEPVAEVEPLPPVAPAPATAPPAEPEPAVEEVPVEQEDNMMQWILYGIIAFVNVLIIAVIYILYRKFFGQPSENSADKKGTENPKAEQAAADPEAFAEPPMDEMNIADLEDDEPTEEASELDAALAEDDDPLADLNPTDLDDEDEDPEFDLDDFAPDSLDDDDDEDLKV